MSLSQLAAVLFWILIVLATGQALLVGGFVFALLRWRSPPVADDRLPKAAVILCLRGADPFLENCLTAVQSQDYPDYEVHIIIDHESDEAAQYVQRFCELHSNQHLVIHYLTEPGNTCSLKCSSVVQVTRQLDDSYGFIAQLDADTIPHREWLRELGTALLGQQVGAATGNRWYMPTEPTWGALVRYLWNSAAVVQMYWYQIAWGGTLAVKLAAVKKAELLDRWSRAFCEDTMLYSQLGRGGFRLAFVPSLMMVNRELCDVPGFYQWVRRQLLTAKLYHPGWQAVVGHAVLTSLLPAALVVLSCIAAVVGDTTALLTSVEGIVAYETSMAMLLVSLELAVRRVVRRRGESTRWMDWKYLVRLPLALLITQAVYARAVVSVLLLRSVSWRGIDYQIRSPWDIRMERYVPYAPAENSTGAKHSL